MKIEKLSKDQGLEPYETIGEYHNKTLKYPDHHRSKLIGNIGSAADQPLPRKGEDAILHKFWGNFISLNNEMKINGELIWNAFQGTSLTSYNLATNVTEKVVFDTDLREATHHLNELLGQQIKADALSQISGGQRLESMSYNGDIEMAKQDVAEAIDERIKFIQHHHIPTMPDASWKGGEVLKFDRRGDNKQYLEFCTEMLENICREASSRFGKPAGEVRGAITRIYRSQKIGHDEASEQLMASGIDVVDHLGKPARAILVNRPFSFDNSQTGEQRFARGGVLISTERGISAIDTETFLQAFAKADNNSLSSLDREILEKMPCFAGASTNYSKRSI